MGSKKSYQAKREAILERTSLTEYKLTKISLLLKEVAVALLKSEDSSLSVTQKRSIGHNG